MTDSFVDFSAPEPNALCSLAFIVMMPMFGTVNEVIKDVLVNLDNQFDKAPHDTKFLVVVRKNVKAGYWPYMCKFELVDTIPAGTKYFSVNAGSEHGHGEEWDDGFASGKRQMCKLPFEVAVFYRDAMTVTKYNPSMVLHIRWCHFGNEYTEHLKAQGCDMGLQEPSVQLPPSYFCSCRII